MSTSAPPSPPITPPRKDSALGSSSSLDQFILEPQHLLRSSPLGESASVPPRKGSISGEWDSPMVWSRTMFKAFYVMTLGVLLSEIFSFLTSRVWSLIYVACSLLYPLVLLIFIGLAIFSKSRGVRKSELPWQFTPTQLSIILCISEAAASIVPGIAYFIFEPRIVLFFLPTVPLVCFSCFLFLTSYWHPGLPMKIASEETRAQALTFTPKAENRARLYITQDCDRTSPCINVILDRQWIAQVAAPRFTCIDVAPGDHTLVLSLAGVHAFFHKEAVVSLSLGIGEIAVIDVRIPAKWTSELTTVRNDTAAMRSHLSNVVMTLPWIPVVVSTRDLERARAAAAGSDLYLTLPQQLDENAVAIVADSESQQCEEDEENWDCV